MTHRNRVLSFGCLALASALAFSLWFMQRPQSPQPVAVKSPLTPAPEQPSARDIELSRLKASIPGVNVTFDALGLPGDIHSLDSFLTGPNGSGGGVSPAFADAYPQSDPHRAIKAFLDEHKSLFGFDASILKESTVERDYVNAHNKMRTLVFRQTRDGIPIHNAMILANVTAKGELVNLGSQFIPNAGGAAVGTDSATLADIRDPISAAREALSAALNDGPGESEHALIQSVTQPSGKTQKQSLASNALKGVASAELTWVPVSATNVRLSWDVIYTDRASGEMQRKVVDARSTKTLSHTNLTAYLMSKKQSAAMSQRATQTQSGAVSPMLVSVPTPSVSESSTASFAPRSNGIPGAATPIQLNVFTAESPTPFFPAYPSFRSGPQPPQVMRTLLTLDSLNPNASPAGWIDANLETRGNNVDAHLDVNNDDIADLPRPRGTGTNPVVFDFPLDLTQPAGTYSAAATVQLFYLCNLMHDKMYDFGFTEAAGNFQNFNFGRGGAGNDAVFADSQDGGGTNNANFGTPPDGFPGQMQMYLWPQATPTRDGSLDATIVAHEYTHGISNRLVGGGALISSLQTSGMGEGWSDFVALSVFADSKLDVNGAYPVGGYAIQGLASFPSNYFAGIRRYPYCREPGPIVNSASTNPLTFGDIKTNNEVHAQGEVWCAALWECRTLLVLKYANTATDGGRLMLQLVIDGMKLSPVDPTFTQARDAIIQADLVNNGGANKTELWTGFAKRGLGFSAASGSNSSTGGVVEAFDVPSDLKVLSFGSLTAYGPIGGTFVNGSAQFTIQNANGSSPINWSVSKSQPWVSITPSSGTLAPNATDTVTVSLNSAANTLAAGTFTDTVTFSVANGIAQTRPVSLRVLNTLTKIADTFDTGIDLTQWSTITGVSSPNFPPIAPMASNNSLWFTHPSSRVATSAPMNTTGGGAIKFSLFIGQSTFPQDVAEIGENVVLEYSIDGGTTYTPISTYLPASVTTWTRFAFPIPQAAKTTLTYFRWRQVLFSGATFDNWALDNVSIGSDLLPNPTVTLNQAVGQADPTRFSTLHFTVQFSKPVFNLTSAGVTLGGTAGATTVQVSGSGTTWDIAVSGMSAPGTVTASINPGAAIDADSNPNFGSTSTDNVITYEMPATLFWTGESLTSDNWSDDANWGGSHLSAGDNIVFLDAVRLHPINDLPQGTTFASIQFNGDGFVVNGNAVQLSSPSPLTNSGGNNLLGLDVTALSTPAINATSNTQLYLSGTWSSTLGLNAVGLGTLILNAPNTYSGPTLVVGGSLVMGVPFALPSTTTVSLVNATLDFSDGSASYPQQFAGVGGSGSLTNSDTAVATFTDVSTSTLSFTGTVSGALNYTKIGSGTFTLSGTNTYSGTTSISAGRLIAISNSALGSNATTATVTGGVLEFGSGVVTSKQITINGGTVAVNGSALLNAGAVLTGPGTFDVVNGNLAVRGLSGNGALKKTNAGSFSPLSPTTYSGVLSMIGGTTTIASSIPCSATVYSSATLAGTGTLGNVTLSGGTFRPNTGVFNVADLTCDSSSTLSFTLNNSTSPNFSQIKASGTVALNDATLAAVISPSVPVSTPVRIIDNLGSGDIVGHFAGLSEGAVLPTLARIDYIGGTGNDVTLSKVLTTTTSGSNSGAITISNTINDNATAATPYPSTITIAGVTNPVVKVTATLTGFTHTFLGDVFVMLVGPQGQHLYLMSNEGDLTPTGSNINGVNFTFDDAATGYIPSSTTVVSGTYKPAFSQGALIAQSVNGAMPAPSPSDSTGPALSIFNGVDPNGAWSLYVYDGFDKDIGMISGGWSLQLSLGPASGTLNLATPVLDKPIINEGDTVTVSGIFSDTLSTQHSVTIDWGDGSSPSSLALPASATSYSISHVYADDIPVNTSQDNFTIKTTLSDGIIAVSKTTPVTVKNVAPSNLIGAFNPPTLQRGTSTPVTLTGGFTDPSTGDIHTVTINWGDGAQDTLVLGYGINSYSASHTFADNLNANEFSIAVTCSDDDLGTVNATFSLPYVSINPIAAISGAPVKLSTGVPVNLGGSATEPGSHTFTFAWSVKLNNTAFASGTGTMFMFTPGADGPYVISLTATDEGNRSGTASLSYTLADPPVVVSALNANPNPAIVGTPVTLSSTVTDGSTIHWVWDFGDGTVNDGTVGSLTHTFSPVGTYTVTLTTTDAVNLSVVQTISVVIIPAPSNPHDSDGDGFPDELETALGTDPSKISSSPFGSVAIPAPLTITSLSTSLNFKQSNKDSLILKGTLTLPNGTILTGLVCGVDVGGAVQVFTLNSKGMAKTATGQFTLKVSKKVGVPSTFQATFKSVSLRNVLTDEGLIDATLVNLNTTIPVTVSLAPQLLQGTRTQVYNAKQGISGKSKDPK